MTTYRTDYAHDTYEHETVKCIAMSFRIPIVGGAEGHRNFMDWALPVHLFLLLPPWGNGSGHGANLDS